MPSSHHSLQIGPVVSSDTVTINNWGDQWLYMSFHFHLTLEFRMAHFIVTFRFKNDSTYQDRYDSFVDKVKEIAELSPWDETSSFFAFQADDNAVGLCTTLYVETKFDSTKDRMVVIDIDRREKATKGNFDYLPLLNYGLGF